MNSFLRIGLLILLTVVTRVSFALTDVELERLYSSAAKKFVLATNKIRQHPNSSRTELKEAVDALLTLAPQVRATQLAEAQAKAKTEEEGLRSRMTTADWRTQELRSFRSIEASLPQIVEKIRNQVSLSVEPIDELTTKLQLLRAELAAGNQLPSWFLKQEKYVYTNAEVQSNLSKAQLSKQWREATDSIEAEDTTNSRFFVIGIDLQRDPHGQFKRKTNIVYMSLEGLHISDSYWTGILNNPERLAEKSLHSLSYIGPMNQATCCNAGLIVHVPEANLFATHTKDAGELTYGEIDDLPGVLSRRNLLGPDELLRASVTYTEANAVGTHPVTGEKMSVIGVFIKRKKGKMLVSQSEFEWWVAYAKHHALPPPRFVDESSNRDSLTPVRNWWVAKKISERAVTKPKQRWDEWLDLLRKAYAEEDYWGSIMTEDIRGLEKYLTLTEVSPGQFKPILTGKPPRELRWPNDSASCASSLRARSLPRDE